MIDLKSEEGVRTWLRRLMQHLQEQFNRSGEVVPHAYAIVTHDPETGEPHDEPKLAFVAPSNFNGDEEQREFFDLLKEFATRGKALGAAFICEMWAARQTLREVRGGEMPQDRADRREAVVLIVKHQKFVAMWSAEIVRPIVGTPRLKPFAELPAAGAVGPLARFGRTVEFTN